MERTVSSVVKMAATDSVKAHIKADPNPIRTIQSKIVWLPYCSAYRLSTPPNFWPTREFAATENAKAGIIANIRT